MCIRDRYEVKAAVLAAKETTRLPVLVSMTFEESGRTFTGTSIECMVAALEGLGVDAVGTVSYTHLDVYKRQRFDNASKGDQVRVTTPAKAKELGSDYIVVGRPITQADDPVAAYNRCVKEFVEVEK